jgi:two-component system response regulator DesR
MSERHIAMEWDDRIRVLVVDDHMLFAEALMLTLAIDDRIEIVGSASSGAEAVALAGQLRPDVIVMDVHMPNMDGIEATRRIRDVSPRSAVVILTANVSPLVRRYAFAAGAVSYLTKDTPAVGLIDEVVGASKPLATVTQLAVGTLAAARTPA